MINICFAVFGALIVPSKNPVFQGLGFIIGFRLSLALTALISLGKLAEYRLTRHL